MMSIKEFIDTDKAAYILVPIAVADVLLIGVYFVVYMLR